MASISPLPIADEEAEMARVAAELEGGDPEPSALEKLFALASHSGNFAETMDANDRTKLGNEVVDDYEQDEADRKDWLDTCKEALDLAAQERAGEEKTYPWPKASNIKFPLLTIGMLQFNANAYPAIVKGDTAVMCKVIGKDAGLPQIDPQTGQQAIQPGPPGPDGQPTPVPVWAKQPGAKTKRAQRVSDYLNTTLFYRMEGWENDTDHLLMQLPAAGCVFRKVFYDSFEGKQRSRMISAVNVVVPMGARSIDESPRVTERVPDVFPHSIQNDMRSGKFIDVDLWPEPENGANNDAAKRDFDKPRLLLEQHRLIDLDDDGFSEPYIVTVDHETREVLRIEANFSPEDVRISEPRIDRRTGAMIEPRVIGIKKGKFFVKYPFWPDPRGGFYDLGLGHMLKHSGDVINTALNQMIDAGTAQTAGGGFIASGIRLQARGGGSAIRFEPGVYRTVDAPGQVLRDGIVEMTKPQISPITFQVLDLILGVAKEISGIKDVVTGDASNNGQVGTTLALIEQGLKVQNAINKRVFRAGKEEYTLIFENIGKHGGDEAREDYLNLLDDPEADFDADFSSKDLDIRPISDPSAFTRVQQVGKAQFLLGTMQQAMAVGGDGREIMRRVYESADVEDIDKLLPEPQPMPPDPRIEADVAVKGSQAQLNAAKAAETAAKIEQGGAKLELSADELALKRGQQQIDAFRAGREAAQRAFG